MIRVSPYPIPLPGTKPIACTEYNEQALYDDRLPFNTSPVSSYSGAEWLPIPNGRFSLYVAGVPNAGKSYFTAQILKLFPKNYEVLLFSALDEKDSNFDDIPQKIWKINIFSEKFNELNLATIKKLVKNPICVFDDYDDIPDPKVAKSVLGLLNEILLKGRAHEKGSSDVHIIITSHFLNNSLKTKGPIENCDFLCVFPLSTLQSQMELLLCTKVGISKKDLLELISFCKNNKIRKIIVKKTAPQFIITQNLIRLL